MKNDCDYFHAEQQFARLCVCKLGVLGVHPGNRNDMHNHHKRIGFRCGSRCGFQTSQSFAGREASIIRNGGAMLLSGRAANDGLAYGPSVRRGHQSAAVQHTESI